MDSFEDAKKELRPSQYLEIKYEDFAVDPKAVFGTIVNFCHLGFPPEFENAIASFEVESANFKWKEQLTGRQREMLEECLHEHLVRYGYESAVASSPASV